MDTKWLMIYLSQRHLLIPMWMLQKAKPNKYDSFTYSKYDHWRILYFVSLDYRCRTTQLGKEYNGLLSTNITGVPCQKFGGRNNDRGYCRNTKGVKGGPWCYNSDTRNPKWSFCETYVCNFWFLTLNLCLWSLCVNWKFQIRMTFHRFLAVSSGIWWYNNGTFESRVLISFWIFHPKSKIETKLV